MTALSQMRIVSAAEALTELIRAVTGGRYYLVQLPDAPWPDLSAVPEKVYYMHSGVPGAPACVTQSDAMARATRLLGTVDIVLTVPKHCHDQLQAALAEELPFPLDPRRDIMVLDDSGDGTRSILLTVCTLIGGPRG